ncbi:unnamed protein product [Symbiodinium sp. KB8]|nr:unnamed protein product [Symbiodinium sp. KB8]
MPESRRLLAVPFIGKDVPSAASEFAHPEVLIGLTILSYRYEGMRDSDMFHVLEQMKESLKQELGPFPDRPSGIRFTSWLTRANILRSSKGLKELETDVPPLQLFQPRDKKQMRAACILLSNLSETILYYLSSHVFPYTMAAQRTKLTASGYDLGSDMLFNIRLGFSGTPSNLLPEGLPDCK